MSFKKIIFLYCLPLSQKIADDYNLEALQAKGFEVEFWDLSKLYSPNVSHKIQYRPSYSRIFKSYNDFSSALARESSKSAEGVLYIPQLTREFRVVKILRLLTKYNCKLAFYDTAALPIPQRPDVSIFTKIVEAFARKTMFAIIGNIINSFLMKLALKTKFLKEYDFVFAAGEVSVKRWANRAKIIEINSIDSDRVATVSSFEHTSGPYAVFLDEYLPFHPDFKMLGMKTVNPEIYYRLLVRFFDRFEKACGLPVLIAAHPKSNYEDSKVFGERPVLKFRTAELVKGSSVVLCHASTSVGFAVIYKKPIMFLSYSELLEVNPHIHALLVCLAKTLMCPIFELDNQQRLLPSIVDTHAYSSYVRQYLTTLPIGSACNANIISEFLTGSPGRIP